MDTTQTPTLQSLLQAHYGHTSFRPMQLEAVQATLAGCDVLLILPTGGGKSLAFQLPALFSSKITVVVTPLLALAKDQVDQCNDAYSFFAASWSSDTTEERKVAIKRELLADADDCTLRLLYTTPESLATPRLLDLLAAAHEAQRLCSLAVDEAHACSQWGHDFRPAFLQLGDLRSRFPGLPCIAVTATATPQVQQSIAELLCLRQPLSLVASFNRPNISLAVKFKELLGDSSLAAVLGDVSAFIQARPGQKGLVYCRMRKTCDEVAAALREAEVEAAAYHAGLDSRRRERVQEEWRDGGVDVVCATIAFGMGIDVPDVRYVLHFDAPTSLEGFYQECGRGGRDGQPASSVMYVSNAELKKNVTMERGERRGGTCAVAEYVQQDSCRRRALLRHFEEVRGAPCDAGAGELLCDVCTDVHAVRAQLAAVETKLAAAVESRAGDSRACEPDPYDRVDPGSDGEAEAPEQQRQVSATSSLPKAAPLQAQSSAGPKCAPLQLANGAARRPLVQPSLPAKRAPAAEALVAAQPQLHPAVGKLGDVGVATQPAPTARSEAHSAALACVKRPRAAFQAPRRL